MSHEPQAPHHPTDAEAAHSAREEVAVTAPREAPLPDPAGLGFAFSPVDLPEPDEPLPHPLRWTSTVIAVATLLLALFNADALRGWAYELPDRPLNRQVVVLAEQWHDATERAGLTRPVETMRGWWEQAKALRFEGSAPPQTDG